HCAPHLRRTDKSQRLVCARHRAGCAHEPGALFAVDEVGTCPICARGACQSHRAACEQCGRRVCTADLSVESRRCATCAQLAAVSDLPHAVVAAVQAATGSGPKPSRRWRMARDRRHLVVELDLGWRQTAVATRLGITVQPSNATAGAAIAPGMQVVIVSSAGITVTTATNAVTVVIDSNSLGATLLGTATVNAVNGVATFANLSITRAGTGY